MGFDIRVFYLANMFLATPPGEGPTRSPCYYGPRRLSLARDLLLSPVLYVDIAVATVTLSYGSVDP